MIDLKHKTLGLILFALAMFVLVIPASATLSVNASSIGSTFITWSWSNAITATNASLDGWFIPNFDGSAHLFDLSGLPSNETHTFCLYSATDSGCSTASTGADTSIYNQMTALLVQWWYLFVIMACIIVGMIRKLGVFLIVASMVSLYALVMFIQTNVPGKTLITEVPFLIYAFFFVAPHFLAFKKGGYLK
jgi:hypothetical protein